MAAAAGRRNAVIVVVGVIVAVIGLVVWRASANSLSPEADQVQKGLAQSGFVTPDPAALPTEPGQSVRLDVRGNRLGSPLQSCVVTVGQSLSEVTVGECTPVGG